MGVRLEVRVEAGEDDPLVYELDQSRIALGRAASADVRLPHAAVSATHATIRVHNAGYAIFDEGSSNGTYFEETRIAVGRAKPLRTGDTVRIGPYAIVVRVGLAVGRSTTSDGTAAHARALLARIEGDRPLAVTIENGRRAGESIPLPRGPAELTVGRGEEAGIVLDDADCSREHAAFVLDEGGASIVDRDSKNGVTVNGRAVRERRLRDRDEIVIGATRLVFDDPLAPALAALEGVPDEPHAPPKKPAPAPVTTPPPAEDAAAGAPEVVADLVDGAPSEASPKPRASARPRIERRRDGMTDGLVYMLAGAVLALSLVGIYLLVSSS